MENTGDSGGGEGKGKLAIASVFLGAAQGFNQHARGIVRRRRAKVRLGVIFPLKLLFERLRPHAKIRVGPETRHQESGRGGARGGDKCRRVKRRGPARRPP